MKRRREGRLGRRAWGADLLTKERDSVTDKSRKLAEEAEERERNRTGETGSEDSEGTQSEEERQGRQGERDRARRRKDDGGENEGDIHLYVDSLYIIITIVNIYEELKICQAL